MSPTSIAQRSSPLPRISSLPVMSPKLATVAAGIRASAIITPEVRISRRLAMRIAPAIPASEYFSFKIGIPINSSKSGRE